MKKTLVGWASCPSGADKMSTPQEKLLQHFSLATPVGWVSGESTAPLVT
ncbi:hypothetical protein FDUTEX481_03866 [Tolypothrix sp. PCC 7601]|nr:hypothetical protein FDUTEX481_03866 [Tolypothrix sp. PCC 7601]